MPGIRTPAATVFLAETLGKTFETGDQRLFAFEGVVAGAY